MVKKKVGSITLAVGLITVGVLLFCKNFIELPIKDIYKYWPVLLIGLGLEMILYMVLYGRNNSEVKLSVDGLCIVFIIVLGLLSNGVRFINIDDPGRMFFNFNGNSVIDGVRYRTEVNETYTKDNISSSYNIKELKVTNTFGDIKVLPTDAKSISIEAKVRVKCNDENKARAYAKDAVEIKEGEITEISPKNPSGVDKNDFGKAQIDFTIYVPKQASVDADGSFGDISVEGIDGNAVLENKNGQIKASGIGGSVDIDNSFGDIEVKGVGGKADIANKNGEITAEEITGAAVLENHFGDIQAAKVGGDLKTINNNGQITVQDITGKAEITNSFGDINMENIGSDINVENKNGRIEAVGAKGSASITNSFGDISYESPNINNSDIYAKTRFGDINGSEPLQVSKNNQETTAQGKLGSGQYKVELMTNNGNIDIK
ncbi:MAG: LiaI-LiaF-like domain-containing protein [Caulobacteraceae bacterium]